MSITKVFVAGSRNLLKLNDAVELRIDNIIHKGLKVIIGDANGADKAVQHYLHSKNYKNVEIFCMEGACRHNVGNWPIRIIPAPGSKRKDFAFYSIKDLTMANEADYGLMLWDGQSRGTHSNIVQLLTRGKPCVVYLSQNKSFHTLREIEQLSVLFNI